MTETTSIDDYDVDEVPTEERTITVCHVDEHYDFYGGRGTYGRCLGNTNPPTRGWLGNPFKVEDYGREGCIQRYEKRFLEVLVAQKEVACAAKALNGCAVACYCRRSDEHEPACHLDVVQEWIEQGYIYYLADVEHDITMPEWKLDAASKPEVSFQ